MAEVLSLRNFGVAGWSQRLWRTVMRSREAWRKPAVSACITSTPRACSMDPGSDPSDNASMGAF